MGIDIYLSAFTIYAIIGLILQVHEFLSMKLAALQFIHIFKRVKFELSYKRTPMFTLDTRS